MSRYVPRAGARAMVDPPDLSPTERRALARAVRRHPAGKGRRLSAVDAAPSAVGAGERPVDLLDEPPVDLVDVPPIDLWFGVPRRRGGAGG